MRFKADIGLAESRLIRPPSNGSTAAPPHRRPVAGERPSKGSRILEMAQVTPENNMALAHQSKIFHPSSNQ
jgi:hypothetical protein